MPSLWPDSRQLRGAAATLLLLSFRVNVSARSLGNQEVSSLDDRVFKGTKAASYAQLHNQSEIPLIGLGVGNLRHDLIVDMVAEALQDDKQSYLIESAHVSGNEAIVAEGILKGTRHRRGDDVKVQVHVITKVWYTHLGYGRTKLAIQESMSAYQPVIDSGAVDLRFHVFLHWPRCYESIPWMDCKKEEASLPDHVKTAGPDPNTNLFAWKDSWRMLEDAYLSHEYPIESIGLANFPITDLEDLDSFARVLPSVIQTNIWNLLYDSELIDYCHARGIHIQVYNALQGTVSSSAPVTRAHNHIHKVALELSTHAGRQVTPAQVILAWLTQHGISVAPRTSRMSRLSENSAVAIASLPALTDSQVEVTAHAVEAFLSGVDLDRDVPVTVSFQATTNDVMVYCMGDVAEIQLAHVKKGDSFNETSYPGHVFRLYDTQNKDVYVDHHVNVKAGLHQTIQVDLPVEEQRVSRNHKQGTITSWLESVLNTNR